MSHFQLTPVPLSFRTECFAQLAMFPPGREALLQQAATIRSALEAVAATDMARSPESQKFAKATLVTLFPEMAAIEVKVQENLSVQQHVMLSYNWDYQSTIKRIHASLTFKHGYTVWIDIEKMQGSTIEAMSLAVENAAVVVYGISRAYKESVNCRLEAQYAFQQDKDMVPLMLEDGYRATGWLGMLLGVRLWYAFYGKVLASESAFEDKIKELCRELADRGQAIVPHPQLPLPHMLEAPLQQFQLEPRSQPQPHQRLEQAHTSGATTQEPTSTSTTLAPSTPAMGSDGKRRAAPASTFDVPVAAAASQAPSLPSPTATATPLQPQPSLAATANASQSPCYGGHNNHAHSPLSQQLGVANTPVSFTPTNSVLAGAVNASVPSITTTDTSGFWNLQLERERAVGERERAERSAERERERMVAERERERDRVAAENRMVGMLAGVACVGVACAVATVGSVGCIALLLATKRH